MSEEWRSLLESGRKDLVVLELFQSHRELADEIFGFHAQQAVEKAMKAWISRLGGSFPPTHDLGKLVPILGRLGVDMELLWPLVGWNAFAVQYRYDGLPDDAQPLPRRGMIEAARQLFERVESGG